jgi:hypothetical protein
MLILSWNTSDNKEEKELSENGMMLWEIALLIMVKMSKAMQPT